MNSLVQEFDSRRNYLSGEYASSYINKHLFTNVTYYGGYEFPGFIPNRSNKRNKYKEKLQ